MMLESDDMFKPLIGARLIKEAFQELDSLKQKSSPRNESLAGHTEELPLKDEVASSDPLPLIEK